MTAMQDSMHRTALGTILRIALLASLVTITIPFAHSQEVAPRLTQENFSNPGVSRPKMRWWLPLAPLRRDELERELQDIADAGFSGVEILGTAVTPPASLEQYGFGTPAWNQAMRDVLSAAKARKLTVDFTIGPSYPAATPDLEAEDLATSQELVYGSAEVEREFDGALPKPSVGSPAGERQHRLVGVSVARITGERQAGSLALDPASLRDVTDQVREGKLRWRAPSAGAWVIIASYARSTGHIIENVTAKPARVVDHFSAAGTEAITRMWDTKVLTPEVRALVREVGGDVFEDSLHLTGYTLWTDKFLAEFERRRGYSLRPFLPVIYIANLNDFFFGIRGGPKAAALNTETAAAFELANGESRRIRNDYYQVLSELYTEHHLAPLRAWFNRQGLKYRVQTSYGQSLEGTGPAAAIDVPETESFQQADMVDGYRVQAAVAHITGQRVYSTECCATMGGAHALPWRQTLWHVDRNYAGGVNQAVLHGYSYIEAANATWPGWFPFGQMFSENHGRQPNWKHAGDITDYLGREQLVLRQGEAKVDVAIYRLSYWDYGRGGSGRLRDQPEYYNDPALSRAGYTYEFLSPALLARPEVTVSGGTLAPRGPAYRALVLDRQREMPAAALQRIIDLAKQGLPVIIIGETPTQEPFHVSSERDAEVRKFAEQLKEVKAVRSIAQRSELPAVLASIGVEPATKPAAATDLFSVRRVDGDRTYVWFFNPGKTPIDTHVSIAGSGAPLELDAWSGCVRTLTPAGASARDRVELPLHLAPGDTRIIALGSLTASTDAHCKHPPGSVSRTIELGQWALQVESWQPGTTASDIVRTSIDVKLPALRPWPEVPQLEDVSGIGTYRTHVDLNASEAKSAVTLNLGAVEGTARVFVNGQRVRGLDQHTLSVPIGSYVRAGKNEIAIETATTLRNRMRVLDEQQRSRPRQPYGLLGPVKLEISDTQAR
jgi:hypothetical protein